MLLSTKSIAAGLAGAVLLASAGTALADPGAATASVNVRSGPGTGYRVVDTLYPGEAVDIRNCQGGWCYVVHSGPDGWVSANYLSGADTGYDDGYYEPAPVYVEPAPIYTPPPTIIVRPPYNHNHHHYRHHHAGKPWTGKPGHPWTGKPPIRPPHVTPSVKPHITPPVHMPRPVHVNPGPKAGPGKGGNICAINPDVCKPHHRGH